VASLGRGQLQFGLFRIEGLHVQIAERGPRRWTVLGVRELLKPRPAGAGPGVHARLPAWMPPGLTFQLAGAVLRILPWRAIPSWPSSTAAR